MARTIYKKTDGKGKEQDWFKENIYEVMHKHGVDPFMVVGFKDFSSPNIAPVAGFYGNDLGDLLMLLGQACEMLSSMYKEATPIMVADAVRKILDMKYNQSGQLDNEEMVKKIYEVMKGFGGLDAEGATKLTEEDK